MKKYTDFVKGIVMVGQFGFWLVTPPLCMALLAHWLMKKFGIGMWLMILFLVIGLLTAVTTAVDFFKTNIKKAEKTAKDVPLSFRQHE